MDIPQVAGATISLLFRIELNNNKGQKCPTTPKNMKAENKATDYFKLTIQRYLEQRVQSDELFAPRYADPKKNIDDCITYILNYVQQSGICGFSDDEIYSLALHYYPK